MKENNLITKFTNIYIAPAKHVKMHLKKEASKIDNIMKVQKMTITKKVNKLIDQFKSEQKYVNSPLIKQAASEFETAHKKLIEQLAGLDQNMQKYMILSVQAVTELGEGVLEQKSWSNQPRWKGTRTWLRVSRETMKRFLGKFILYLIHTK